MKKDQNEDKTTTVRHWSKNKMTLDRSPEFLR